MTDTKGTKNQKLQNAVTELMIFTEECLCEKENMKLQGRVESFIKIDDTELLWCKLMIHFSM